VLVETALRRTKPKEMGSLYAEGPAGGPFEQNSRPVDSRHAILGWRLHHPLCLNEEKLTLHRKKARSK